MVRKQNERTILLQYRIIPLSLPTKTLFLILASRPLSTRLGAFSSPRNISPQIFSEIFSNQAKATFFCIFGAKNYGGRRLLALPKWGGVSLFVCSPHSKLASILSSFPTPFPAFIVSHFQTSRAKGAKVKIYLLALVFSRDFRRQEGAKS